MLEKGDETGKSLMRRQMQMETERSTLDSHCTEIAELVLPMMNVFFKQGNHTKGDKRSNKLMEGTAPHALQRYASAIEGFLTPRGERWSKLTTNNKDLNKLPQVKLYFEEINDLLFKVRYDPRAGFGSQVNECLQGVGAFGTTALFPDGRVSQSDFGGLVPTMSYKSIPLVQIFISENSAGVADTAHRKFRHAARNWVADFKEECPERIRKIAEKEPDREFDLVHVVMPNPEYRRGALGWRGMKFASYYVDPECGKVVRRGGYNTQRYSVARGTKAPGEVYGRSPSMLILPEIKTVNEMRRGLLRAQHMTLNPPTLLHSEYGANFQMEPRSLNYGMVSAEGRPLAIPYQMGNTFPPTEREMERIRELINEAFLLTLFQVLVNRNSQETATMTLQKAKEQAIILSPLIGKLQTEFLGGIIESEIDILSEAGALPEMPEEMIEAQGEYSVTYASDIQRALETGEIEAYGNWLQDALPMAERFNPHLLEVVDHEGVLMDAAEKRGISAKFIRTKEQLEELRARKAEEQQQAAALPVAQQAAEIDKSVAQAENLRGRVH
jgi:hypothetical protein